MPSTSSKPSSDKPSAGGASPASTASVHTSSTASPSSPAAPAASSNPQQSGAPPSADSRMSAIRNAVAGLAAINERHEVWREEQRKYFEERKEMIRLRCAMMGVPEPEFNERDLFDESE
ncbi:hypothetical protein JCM10207_000346 [Rhodosporidiobolus poonsookiae]